MQFTRDDDCEKCITSKCWVNKFKRINNIRQQKITKYVNKSEIVSMEYITEAIENFLIKIESRYDESPEYYILNIDRSNRLLISIKHRIGRILESIGTDARALKTVETK